MQEVTLLHLCVIHNYVSLHLEIRQYSNGSEGMLYIITIINYVACVT